MLGHAQGALLSATSCQAIGLGIIVSRFDWAAEARKAAARVDATKAAGVDDADEEAQQLLATSDQR